MHKHALQVSSRLWRQAVSALSPMIAADIVGWLPADLAGGKAGAAVALLGNLAEVGGKALQV